MKYDIILDSLYSKSEELESFFEMKYDIMKIKQWKSCQRLESFFEMKYDIISTDNLLFEDLIRIVL